MFVEFFHYLFTERGIENEFGTFLEMYISYSLMNDITGVSRGSSELDCIPDILSNPNVSFEFLERHYRYFKKERKLNILFHPFITDSFLERNLKSILLANIDENWEGWENIGEDSFLIDEILSVLISNSDENKRALLKRILGEKIFNTCTIIKRDVSETFEIMESIDNERKISFVYRAGINNRLVADRFVYNEQTARDIFLRKSKRKVIFDENNNRYKGGIDIFQGLPRFSKVELKRRAAEFRNRRKYAPGKSGYRKTGQHFLQKIAECNFSSLL